MSKHEFARPVILYADDHRDAHAVMNRAFSTADVKAVILPATDGLEVLAYLSKSIASGHKIYPWPDLLIVDLRMPKLSGFALLEALKNSPEFPNIPIVIFSSSENPADFAKAKALGCSAFVRMQVALGNLVDFAKAVDVEFFGAEETHNHQKFSSFCVPL